MVTNPNSVFSPRSRNKCGVTSLQSAFTLIELSIVMVIIGLLVGGVLVGNDLIYAASVRAQIAQIQDIETQINTFKIKYNCLPGDCANATDFFGTTSLQGDAVNNGNGDGIIKSTYGNAGVAYGAVECTEPDIAGEVSQLFLHLYMAGISKDYTKGSLTLASTHATIGKEYPYAKFGNGTGIFVTCLGSVAYVPNATPSFLRNGNIIAVGATGRNIGSGFEIFFSLGMASAWWGGFGLDGSNISITPFGIPADAARRIDEKIDDGLPSSGKFGIIAGSSNACDNVYRSNTGLALLTAYPAPSVSCNATVGKRID